MELNLTWLIVALMLIGAGVIAMFAMDPGPSKPGGANAGASAA